MSKPRTTAVVVTYNSAATIDRALSALGPRDGIGGEEGPACVVVDNASTDGTAERVRERHPWVEVVASPENLGFGRGCNLGFERVTTPFVLFLNPDARIGLEALGRLEDFLEAHPRAGLCAPAIREGPGKMQEVGMLLTPGAVLRAAAGWSAPMPGARELRAGEPPFRTNWLCGAVLMARSELFRTLGGFDPRFFLYFEETDLCLRAARHGAELWAVGEAVAEHQNAASAETSGLALAEGCIAEHYFRSRLYYLMKSFGAARALAVEACEPLLLLLRDAGARLRGRRRGGLRARLAAPWFELPEKVG